MGGRRKGFDAHQPRDHDGKWTDEPGGAHLPSYGLNPQTGKPFTPAEATAMLLAGRRKAPAKKTPAKAPTKKPSGPVSYGINPRTGRPFTPGEATAMLTAARKAPAKRRRS